MKILKDWIIYSLGSLEEAYYLKFIINDKLIDRIINEISELDWRSGSCGGCI